MKPKLGLNANDVERAIRGVQAILLPIRFAHLDALSRPHLYEHDRDTFDRMLIAQALAEELPTISSNTNFSQYKG